MKPFISLCMIVKNEGKVLNRCLSSIVTLVDEIIIVDTGSTDNTIEIASQYTKNVYNFRWVDDFSAARNFAAEKATGEWILVLDADEYIDEENFKVFKNNLIEDKGIYDTYTAKILNFTGFSGESLLQNYHSRIYKNTGEIIYYRQIHEQLKHVNDEKIMTKKSNLLIFHSGYLRTTVNEKNKSKRNKDLIEKEINKGNQNEFDLFNLGNEYFSIQEYEKALNLYIKAYKLKSDIRSSWVSYCIVQIINCLMCLEKYDDALKVIRDSESIYFASPEFPYLKGEIFFKRGQFDDAREVFHEILNNEGKYIDIILRPDLKELGPHIRLGEIYFSQEAFDKSIYHYSNVLNIDKYNLEAVERVVTILSKFHTPEEISEFIKSNQLVNRKNIIKYIKVSFEIGNPTLAIHLLEDYKSEFKLLFQVAKMKRLFINNETDFDEFNEIFSPEIMKKLLESNWVNVVDLILLKVIGKADDSLIINSLIQNEKLNKLIDVVDGKESIINVNENIIIFALQQFFNYKRYDLCNVILSEIERTNESTIHKVAKVLFTNGFKAESLQLYSLCNWSLFDIQDYINVIDSLVQSGNYIEALDISNRAIRITEDFRFYKFAIEILNNLNYEEEKEEFITNAMNKFPDSNWLREKYLDS